MPSLPRLYHPDSRLVQWADRLIAKIVGGELGGLELSNVLYVDVNGVNATAARGNIDKPYATVAAAMAAALSGDVIQVGPGVFSEPTVNWKTSVSGIKLRGSGELVSVLSESTGNGPAIAAVPLATESLQAVEIEGLRIVNNDAAAYAINIDGSVAGAGAGGAIGLVKLHDLLVTNTGGALAIRVATADKVDIDTVDTDSDDMLLEEVGGGVVRDLNAGGYAIDYDLAEVIPSGRNAIAHTGCLMTTLTVENHAWAAFGKECQAGAVIANLVDDAVVGHGRIDYTGRVVNGVAVTFDFQNDPGSGYRQDCINFDYATIGTTFSVADQGASTIRCKATARQAVFRTTDDQAISAGLFCDLDLRKSLFEQDSLVVPAGANNGTIDRSVWSQVATAGAASMPRTMVFADSSGNAIPFPAGAAYTDPVVGGYMYNTTFESDVAADAPLIVVNPRTGSKLAASVEFDCATTPNLSGDTLVVVERY